MRNACDVFISKTSRVQPSFYSLAGTGKSLFFPIYYYYSVLFVPSHLFGSSSFPVAERRFGIYEDPVPLFSPSIACQAETSLGVHTHSSFDQVALRIFRTYVGTAARAGHRGSFPVLFSSSPCNVVGRAGHDCDMLKPSLSVQCKRD